MTIKLPRPLFDTMLHLNEIPKCITEYIENLQIPGTNEEFKHAMEFLKSYQQSNETFNTYRREVERILQWSWQIRQKLIKNITRNDIRDYLSFVGTPPKTWVSTKIVTRFIEKSGIRTFNEKWRPFVIKVHKADRSNLKKNSYDDYHLKDKSVESIFAVLSSFFTFLQQENYLQSNPVMLVRQKKGYIRKQQNQKVTRKLSKIQWHYVIETAEEMANLDDQYERTLFLLSAFFLLGLRISELSDSKERPAQMGNFAPDKNGLWWFQTVGKGNKWRDVAVPDSLLSALKRYRASLNLSPLPSRSEEIPLFPKLKGKGGLGTRQLRNLVQAVFDNAVDKLYLANKVDEAVDLKGATVHWLRHTAISYEVEWRPREHIRDDVGHENPATMDKYIDIDRADRHRSAQDKKLKPI